MENLLMRLAFHDCIPYQGGEISGEKGGSADGCDGCLNWKGMDWERMQPDDASKRFTYPAANFTTTSNQGLGRTAQFLELIYTTVDWPLQTPNLQVSLYQSGKSRADLWQLAGLVALEQALERANRACDLDYHARQQVTLLEGREKCEIKLNKPLKFLTGRKDCISDDPEGRGYVTSKEENQPKFMGSANENIDYGRNFFNMDAEHFAALMGIHGAVHNGHIGLKYTWMGAGYISNVYFKQLANKPLYKMGKGGDLSFTSKDESIPNYNVAVGDGEGNPIAHTGWRTSCMYVWNTTMGGPCVLRPTPVGSWDAPSKTQFVNPNLCLKGVSKDGTCIVNMNSMNQCKGFHCDKRGVFFGGKAKKGRTKES